MELTFLDFFSGVGGFRKGMEMAGHKCLGHCEVDKYANMSYQEIHDIKEGEWFNNDIRRVRAEDLPRTDVWCFGFPCQDISVAGKKNGFKGNRSSLFFTVTRLINDTKEEDRPKYLFIENVKNLLSVNRGFDFAKLLIELDKVGYDAEWQVLNSKFYGVPQNRERVFIIGHLRGRSTRKVFPIRRNSETISIKEVKCADYRYDEGLRIRHARCEGMAGNDISNSIYVIKEEPKILVVGNVNPSGKGMNGLVIDSKGLSGTLTTNKGEGPKVLVQACLTPDRVNKRQNGRRFKEDGEPMFTLTSQDRHGILIKKNTKKGYVEAFEGDGIRLDHLNGTTGRGRVQTQSVSTLTTSCQVGVVEKGFRIRKLTPKECFRLQGWDDESFERAAKVCSNSQLYKQAGNGVTVNVIYEIAKRL